MSYLSGREEGRPLGNLCTSHDPSPGASRHPLPVAEGRSGKCLLPGGEGARRADEGRRLRFLRDVATRGLLDGRPTVRRGCPLAGEEGFEPSNGGSKGRCLTTWRLPNRAWQVMGNKHRGGGWHSRGGSLPESGLASRHLEIPYCGFTSFPLD